MRNKILFTLIFLLIFQLKTFAIDIIYPKSNGVNVYANATFFVGNADYKNNLFLNGERIELLENGSFVKYVPLKDGENTFFFEEKDKENGKIINTLEFKVNKTEPPQSCINEDNTLSCTDKLYIATVKQDNVPLREQPDEDAKRLSHIDENTILILNGTQNHYYRVELSNNKYAWILDKYISEPVEIENKLTTNIDEIKFETDKNSYTFLYKLKFPVPYIVDEIGNKLTLKMYNVDTSEYDKTCDENYIIEPSDKNILSTTITLPHILWGYDVSYKNGYLTFKINKQPQIDIKKPLKNIKIVIDPGHGGKEPGAVGPTRVKESTINLDVAKKLEKVLKDSGAQVYMVRDEDVYVDLYDRIKFTKDKSPLFLISLHANALPDGGNPELKHGTSAFYYYPQAKNFANTIQKQMLLEAGTKDDGVSKRSFVLTRNSSCLSILVEMAYMVHPQEYTLLLDDDFRQKVANSIKNGIEKYLIENAK